MADKWGKQIELRGWVKGQLVCLDATEAVRQTKR